MEFVNKYTIHNNTIKIKNICSEENLDIANFIVISLNRLYKDQLILERLILLDPQILGNSL